MRSALSLAKGMRVFHSDGSFLFEDGLHLQAEFYGFIMAVVRDIGPFDPLAGGDRLYHLDLMGESDGEIPGSDGFAGRQEGSVDGGAAFSIQYVSPGRRSFFAVATTSPVKSCADPVGSPRSATEATLMPSSRPIRWAGR